MRKNRRFIVVCLKQNITSDFVSVCFNCVSLYFKILKISRKDSRKTEKRFLNQVLSLSKMKKLSSVN